MNKPGLFTKKNIINAVIILFIILGVCARFVSHESRTIAQIEDGLDFLRVENAHANNLVLPMGWPYVDAKNHPALKVEKLEPNRNPFQQKPTLRVQIEQLPARMCGSIKPFLQKRQNENLVYGFEQNQQLKTSVREITCTGENLYDFVIYLASSS